MDRAYALSLNYYLNAIPKGKENAVHMDVLARRWGTNTRFVRQVVSDLKKEGNIIITNQDGYFRTDDVDEIRKYYAKERAKAIGIFENNKHIREFLLENDAL